jgi:hypothetical protein
VYWKNRNHQPNEKLTKSKIKNKNIKTLTNQNQLIESQLSLFDQLVEFVNEFCPAASRQLPAANPSKRIKSNKIICLFNVL